MAGVLPASFEQGLAYLVAYAAGLAGILLAIGLLGQHIVSRLGWASNPNGWFKKTLAIVFIIVGVAVLFGLDKAVQTYVVQQGWYDPISQFEQSFLGH